MIEGLTTQQAVCSIEIPPPRAPELKPILQHIVPANQCGNVADKLTALRLIGNTSAWLRSWDSLKARREK